MLYILEGMRKQSTLHEVGNMRKPLGKGKIVALTT